VARRSCGGGSIRNEKRKRRKKNHAAFDGKRALRNGWHLVSRNRMRGDISSWQTRRLKKSACAIRVAASPLSSSVKGGYQVSIAQRKSLADGRV